MCGQPSAGFGVVAVLNPSLFYKCSTPGTPGARGNVVGLEFRDIETLANIVGLEFRDVETLANIVGLEFRGVETLANIVGLEFRGLEKPRKYRGTRIPGC